MTDRPAAHPTASPPQTAPSVEQATASAEQATAPAAPEPAPASDSSPDSPDSPHDLWQSVSLLHSWLESNRVHDGRELLLLRMLKLQEEVGEVAQAVIGATGSNPRKGTTHTWDDVQSELCDVVITALIALRILTPDAPEVFAAHLAGVRERALGSRHG